jgi:Cytochrome c oxidase biogenesis protein Cmc1 like.
MSQQQQQDITDEQKAKIREASRDGRLSFRKFGEHQLRREFKDMAIEKCKEHIHAFGKCAQEQGLMVVFKCRQFNRDLNACMAIHNSNEAFEEYKKKNEDGLMRKIPGMKPKI